MGIFLGCGQRQTAVLKHAFKGSEIIENRTPFRDLGFSTFYLQVQHWNSGGCVVFCLRFFLN